MLEIAIIGAGNLGRRHLQAVCGIHYTANLYIIDLSLDSLEEARKVLDATPHECIQSVTYMTSVETLPSRLNVVVDATTSLTRLNVLQCLLATAKIDYLVFEKVLFPEVSQYVIAAELLNKSGTKAYVNCARRMAPFYRQLREDVRRDIGISFQVTGNSWGLGCNGIHMIDLCAFLLDDTSEFLFSSAYLNPSFIRSKREGFIEFTGALVGKSEKCTWMSLFSGAQNSTPIEIMINTANLQCHISESNSTAYLKRSKNNWEIEKQPVDILYQSQLTGSLIEQLIDCGDCFLPTYQESSKLHIAFIKALLQHLGADAVTCCIT